MSYSNTLCELLEVLGTLLFSIVAELLTAL
jgi:hypothetical protein